MASTSRKHPARRPVRAAALAAALLPLCACVGGAPLLLSDPPPPPESAPLEVVVDSSLVDDPCVLNRGELGAGTHDVVLISEGGPATVRIRDAAGTVVLSEYVVPQVHDAEPVDLHESEVPSLSVQLRAGDHTVECEPHGRATSSAGLHVVPARPGVEDSGAVQ